jgi:hypothetical protein
MPACRLASGQWLSLAICMPFNPAAPPRPHNRMSYSIHLEVCQNTGTAHVICSAVPQITKFAGIRFPIVPEQLSGAAGRDAIILSYHLCLLNMYHLKPNTPGYVCDLIWQKTACCCCHCCQAGYPSSSSFTRTPCASPAPQLPCLPCPLTSSTSTWPARNAWRWADSHDASPGHQCHCHQSSPQPQKHPSHCHHLSLSLLQ